MLREGDTAPDFELESDGGGIIRLRDLKDKPVVIYFYPKDDTSGCTKEAIAFTEHSAKFSKLGVLIIGISPDTVESHDKFKAKTKLACNLPQTPKKLWLKPTESGSARACMAANIWVWNVPRSWWMRKEKSSGPGGRSKCRAMLRRFMRQFSPLSNQVHILPDNLYTPKWEYDAPETP